jgi:hypothetical protein
LLWYSWCRYQELVALKRFTSGKSGSHVLVFRPRLRDPASDDPSLKSALIEGNCLTDVGSSLLVKTSKLEKVRGEWNRFQTFLVDRLHPFMARAETLLTIR